MRIQLVTQYFPPEVAAPPPNRLGALAEGLAARGHDVEVICEASPPAIKYRMRVPGTWFGMDRPHIGPMLGDRTPYWLRWADDGRGLWWTGG